MTLTDYHTHTFRCGHAVGTMRDYVDAALRAGISDVGLSDHLWLYFAPAGKRDPRWAMPEDQYDAHYEEMLSVREEYRGRIDVRVSVEADFVAGHEGQLRSILSRYDFDYIYQRYFANIQRAIRLGVFDVLAHFDLPKKFGFLPEEDLTSVVAETLDLAKQGGVAIEVSTGGLRKPVAEIYPAPAILREMKKREILIVLSSDAHAPEEVGSGYATSLAFVREAGYDELVVFEGREPRAVPLG